MAGEGDGEVGKDGKCAAPEGGAKGQSGDGYEIYGMRKAKININMNLKGALWRWVWQICRRYGEYCRAGRDKADELVVVKVRVSVSSQKPLLTGRQAGRAEPPTTKLRDRTAQQPRLSHRALCMQPGSPGSCDLQRGERGHAPQPS